MCCASLLETVHEKQAGLVDEIQMFICAAVVGAGKRFFPDRVRLKLELVDEHVPQRRGLSGVRCPWLIEVKGLL